MNKTWYKVSAGFGTDPFGGSELSDKTRLSPYGNMGGDAHTGLLAPSDNNHHPNDYFSESDKTPLIEKKIEKEREEKKKQKKNLKKNWYKNHIFKKTRNKQTSSIKNNRIKIAQWGSGGPKIPFWNNQSWITDTYKDIVGESPSKTLDNKSTDSPATDNYKNSSNPQNNKDNIQLALQRSVTLRSVNGETMEIGTGFFIGENTIMTCAHVVIPNGNLKGTQTTLIMNGKKYGAYVWAYDTNLDVAVLVVNDDSFKSPQYFSLGNSSEVQIGEEIYIVGTPLGYENVVGTGIVSSAPINYTQGNQTTPYMFVSTNILPGNSGGPIVKKDNLAVIGIAAAIIGENSSEKSGSGLNAIIPIDKLKPFLEKNGINFNFQR